jgi:hypothetical protein
MNPNLAATTSQRLGAVALRGAIALLVSTAALALFQSAGAGLSAAPLSPELIGKALERMGCTVWREDTGNHYARAVWQGTCGQTVRTVVTAPEGFSDADLAKTAELLKDAPGVAIWLDGSAVTSQGLEALASIKDLQAVSVSAAQATPALVEVLSESPKLRVICLDPELSAEAIESMATSLRKVRPTVEVLERRPKLGC